MALDRFVVYCLVSIHLIAFLFAYMNQRILSVQIYPDMTSLEAHKENFSDEDSEEYLTYDGKYASGKSYKFINSSLAYQILSQLDIYKPIKYGKKSRLNFDKSFFGLTPDDEYCQKHRAYFVEHPEAIFSKITVLTARLNNSFINTEAVGPIAKIANPEVNKEMPKSLKHNPSFDIDVSITCFFTAIGMYSHLYFDKQFSCLSQESNHLIDASIFSSKSQVAETAAEYMKRFIDRPQCISQGKYFPKTWRLSDEQQCKEFFTSFNSLQYRQLQKDRRIVYIRKQSGMHRGEGVQPVNEEDEAYIRKTYANGTLCGKVKINNIIQHYIHNPLLLNGHKFDFRIYLLIASANPLIAYYHDGFLRVSLSPYDVKSDDKTVLLTNLALNDKIYDEVKKGLLFNGMDEESMKLAQQWSYERLQTTLLEKNVINDTNWLDNYLRPEFKKCMIHLVRMSQSKFLPKSSTYELFGVDFMLDEDLNIWFIEANSGPAFDGYSKPMGKFIAKMLQDHLEIVHGLLRSRMKRVLDYVNKIINEGDFSETKEGVVVKDLEKKRKEFAQIIRNYFESEFTPKSDNGFVKIIDENHKGTSIYQGLVTKQCI